MLNHSKIVGMPSSIDGPLKVTGPTRYAAEHFAPDMLFGHAEARACGSDVHRFCLSLRG